MHGGTMYILFVGKQQRIPIEAIAQVEKY